MEDAPEQRVPLRSGSQRITARGMALLKERLAKAAGPEAREALEREIDAAIVVAPPKDRRSVAFGAHVTVRFENGSEQRFSIVGETEMDVAKGRITEASPLGQALVGTHPGDRVVWHRPAGDVSLQVKAVTYD